MNSIDFEQLGLAGGGRYENSEEAERKDDSGRTIRYLRRRFLPPAEELPVLAEVAVDDGERLDTIAARTLGDPEQYWQICDANNVMQPEQLLDRIGELIRIPGPSVGGRS
ncbi:MAG: hypothetical protein MJE77_26200 [Proteobacteria bacterium]|nr:hypothetical protein [Pseudomonadota bacterium]